MNSTDEMSHEIRDRLAAMYCRCHGSLKYSDDHPEANTVREARLAHIVERDAPALIDVASILLDVRSGLRDSPSFLRMILDMLNRDSAKPRGSADANPPREPESEVVT